MRLVYYGDKISPNITETPEGYLICKNVPIGRTGDMTYTRGELNLDGNPEETVTVHREESEVFNTVAIASFEGKPTTDAHPNEDVMPDNYANYAKGHGQNVRRGTEENNDKLVADLFITDPALINEVKNNIRREISCGYDCNFVPNEDGTFSQRQIRGNHIAIVRDGRAGSSVCIKDSVPASEQQPIRKERISMAKYQKSKRNPILSLFAKSVRDAKDSDEVAELIEEVAEVLDSVEKDEETEKALVADNGGEKKTEDSLTSEGIAELIKSTVEDCVKKAIDSMNAEKAEKADDEDPDALIGELLDELTKESEKSEDEDPDATEDDSAEQEEALTVSAESMDSDNSGLGSVAHDSAIAILKNARPAIAKIKDKTERKRVVDVLIMAVKGQVGSGNQYQSIMKTTAGVAKRKALDSAAATIDTQAVQTAYDRCNPHKKGVQ